jgi:hypothetical protein
MVIQRALFSRNTLKRAEKLQMFSANSCHEPVRWLQDSAQRIDLARMVGPDFNNRHVIRRPKLKDGQWNTDVIIQIARRMDNTVLSRQHLSDHLLCRRLSVASSDSNHRETELSSVDPSELAKRFCRILNNKHRHLSLVRSLCGGFDDGSQCSVRHRIMKKCMSVKTVTFEREKELTGPGSSGVRRNTGNRLSRNSVKIAGSKMPHFS